MINCKSTDTQKVFEALKVWKQIICLTAYLIWLIYSALEVELWRGLMVIAMFMAYVIDFYVIDAYVIDLHVF